MKHDNVYVPEENPNSSKYTLRENVPEDGRHKSNHNPHLAKALNSSYCIVLFFVAPSQECINVALTSRCEKIAEETNRHLVDLCLQLHNRNHS